MMKILDPAKTQFSLAASQRLDLLRDGMAPVEDVHCVMLFPFSEPEQLISVVGKTKDDADEKESEQELGIIAAIDDFPPEQQELIRLAIDNRYFMPEVQHIRSICREHGLDEWTVSTDRGDRVFFVFKAEENLAVDPSGLVIINAIEGCRYKITDPQALPAASRTELNKVLM